MRENIGLKFMRGTYNPVLSTTPQSQGEVQPALQLPIPEGAELISLPDPRNLSLPDISLRAAIEKRATLRKYSPQPLTLEELSYLLWTTQGVKKVTERPATQRTIPSAGARHAFETFLLINRVQGLTPGLYRFLAIEHSLLPFALNEMVNQQLTHAAKDQAHVQNSAVTFVWVAVVERMFFRYVERGYRYMLLDAGHVCQNLYLAAEQVGCGVCAIAAYDDELMSKTFGLDGDNQFVIYAATLGKR